MCAPPEASAAKCSCLLKGSRLQLFVHAAFVIVMEAPHCTPVHTSTLPPPPCVAAYFGSSKRPCVLALATKLVFNKCRECVLLPGHLPFRQRMLT